MAVKAGKRVRRRYGPDEAPRSALDELTVLRADNASLRRALQAYKTANLGLSRRVANVELQLRSTERRLRRAGRWLAAVWRWSWMKAGW